MSDTTVVNLFAGPGTGKSTKAFLTAGVLKAKGVSAELVHEYAKDLTWEERSNALKYQTYIAAKQMYHIHRVLGKVDVIVTDSPILLSSIYKGTDYTIHLERHLLSVFKSWDTLNIFLKRNPDIHPYKQVGRVQTEDEAKLIDTKILALLHRYGIPYHPVEMGVDRATVDQIISLIDAHRAID